MPTLSSLADAPSYIAALPLTGPIEKLLHGCNSVLDVGCGSHSPLRFVKFAGKKVGLDGFEASLDEAKQLRTHDSYIVGDARSIELPPKSFDAVVALEVIEHLEKEDGYPFLNHLETLARKIVIVSTPNGFLPQGAVDGNELQRHLSGWLPAEMRNLGYQVRGIAGAKPLRGELGSIKFHPYVIWWMISKLTEPLVAGIPDWAFSLLCYKRLD